MHIHILGICGTFMGGLAALAKQCGHRVSGSDAKVYPPMSTQLQTLGIALNEGYQHEHLQAPPDCVIVGNVLSRGNPAVEYALNRDLAYTSGPQWLGEHILRGRHVLAVAGTHGKTTTASMLAWILEYAGLKPGFLIGGVPGNFDVSARMGGSPFFVVEADEYDSAFFDKRSKFVHYRPRTLVLNNLEFDHADIFPDLASIQRQFHHLIRTVPGDGLILCNASDHALDDTLKMGCWSERQSFAVDVDVDTEVDAEVDAVNIDWRARLLSPDGSRFTLEQGDASATVGWQQIGRHNVSNALAAAAAAAHVGVSPTLAAEALTRFAGVRRRLEVCGRVRGITIYDDFAHHPGAIKATLTALRAHVGTDRIVAVLEPRSNTMRMGLHKAELAQSLAAADRVWLFQPPDMSWSLEELSVSPGARARVSLSVDAMVDELAGELCSGDHVLIMSNGSFAGLHGRLVKALESG